MSLIGGGAQVQTFNSGVELKRQIEPGRLGDKLELWAGPWQRDKPGVGGRPGSVGWDWNPGPEDTAHPELPWVLVDTQGRVLVGAQPLLGGGAVSWTGQAGGDPGS